MLTKVEREKRTFFRQLAKGSTQQPQDKNHLKQDKMDLEEAEQKESPEEIQEDDNEEEEESTQEPYNEEDNKIG